MMIKSTLAALAVVGVAATGVCDVSSANIVGYAGSQLDTDYGNVMVTPQFHGVGEASKSIKLGSIRPIAAKGVDLSYAIDVQILDNAGYTIDELEYYWDGSTWLYMSDDAPANDVSISAGQGLWVNNGSGEAVDFQSSGEVGSSDVVVPLDTDYGNVAVGNPFPVAFKLGDVVLEAEESVSLDYAIDIQILDNAGYTIDDLEYYWDGSAWLYMSDDAPANDVMIQPGQGLWINNGTGAAVGFRMPAPEL